MEKTKLGVTASLMAAMMCFLCYYGGYVATALVVGYVLLVEESDFLKRFALKVLALLLTFSLINTVIYLIPNILSLVQSIVMIFDEYGYIEELHSNGFTRFLDFLSSTFGMAKLVIFLLMGVMALLGKEFKIPGFDKLLEKYL